MELSESLHDKFMKCDEHGLHEVSDQSVGVVLGVEMGGPDEGDGAKL